MKLTLGSIPKSRLLLNSGGKDFGIKTMKGIHTEVQDIANDFWEYYGRSEKFGLFIGLINRRGNDWARIKLSEMREYPHLNHGKKMPIQFVMKNT